MIIDLEKKIQKSDIYNICSGRETILHDLLEVFLEIVGPIKYLETHSNDKSRIRDRPYVVGSTSKLRDSQVEIPYLNLEAILKEMYSQRITRI